MAFGFQAGEPGSCKQVVFVTTVSRGDINGTTLAASAPEVLRSRTREARRMNVWVGPWPIWLGIKYAHSALQSHRSRRPKAPAGLFTVAVQEHSAKASLAVVCFAGSLKRVPLCREVWKAPVTLSQGLGRPPRSPSLHPHHPQTDSLQMSHTLIPNSSMARCGPPTPVWGGGGEERVGTGGASMMTARQDVKESGHHSFKRSGL